MPVSSLISRILIYFVFTALNCLQEYRDIKITQSKHKVSYVSTRSIKKKNPLIIYHTYTLSYGAGFVTKSVYNISAACEKKRNHIYVRMKKAAIKLFTRVQLETKDWIFFRKFSLISLEILGEHILIDL